MKNRKIVIGIMLVSVFCVALTACMNNEGNVANPMTSVQPDYMPQGVGQTGVVDATQPPATFDWSTGVGQVEANLNRISEIADSRVAVVGTTALVGVKFTEAYQGEMTERIREMIAAEIKKADPSIQTVAVTAEEADVTAVYEISDRIRGGEPMETLGDKINEIVRNATTMR